LGPHGDHVIMGFVSNFLDSVKQCYLQTKKHAVTSSERAHSITWYKQKGLRNRWASKQVSRLYYST